MKILASFDVCSLFPSLPVDIILDYLGKFLEDNQNTSLVTLAKLCIKQYFFFKPIVTFTNKKKERQCGNGLSLLIAFSPVLFSNFKNNSNKRFFSQIHKSF